MRRQLIELLRFGAVGGIATLVHALGYLLALSVLAPQAANLAGFAGAVAFSYFGHRHFSFKAQDALPKSGLRFVIVSAIGYALNAGLVQMSDKVLGAPELGFWFIALVTPVVTFLLLKFWVFSPAYLSERS